MNSAASPDKPEDELPEGWISKLDSRFNRRFYYHKATKTSQWERPARPAATTPPAPAAATSPRSPSRSPAKDAAGAAAPLQREAERPAAAASAPATDKKRQWSMKYPPDSDSESAGTWGGGDDVWVRVYSTTHQRHYFYNKLTGKTSWLDPRVLPDADSTTDVSTNNSREDADEDDDMDRSPLPLLPNPQELMSRPLFQPSNESSALHSVAGKAEDSPEDFQRRWVAAAKKHPATHANRRRRHL
jgi:hypothetical protein